LAGWSSNNKYSILGSLRPAPQMISYEISLGLSLIGVLILAGTFSLRGIVESQHGHFWDSFELENLSRRPNHRFLHLPDFRLRRNQPHPFDLPEAETELVAGYHTEYSA